MQINKIRLYFGTRIMVNNQGGTIGNFLVAQTTSSLTCTSGQEGEGEPQEGCPEKEGACVCVTHQCVNLLHTLIHWDHVGSHAENFASPHTEPVIRE